MPKPRLKPAHPTDDELNNYTREEWAHLQTLDRHSAEKELEGCVVYIEDEEEKEKKFVEKKQRSYAR